MLSGLDFSILVLILIGGVLLDLLCGELRQGHPLVGFGRYASGLERQINSMHPDAPSSLPGNRFRNYLGGMLAWALAVLPISVSIYWLLALLAVNHIWLALLLHAVLLYFCLGLRSLREHTLPIMRALAMGDLVLARRLTSYIVSRDTAEASTQDIAKASVESSLENGNDAVFGTLFWCLVAGAPGALFYRMSNTLDAMWGYRNRRFNAFGCVAARIDDVLNWIPARLTASSYALLGNWRQACLCWRTQAPQWSSPNAGPVMAAGAGALGLALGGNAIYDGVLEQRPPLGMGRPADASDILRAWQLVARTVALWIAVLLVVLAIVTLKGYGHA